MGKAYYVVKVGRNPGLYLTYGAAQRQLIRHPGGLLKGFNTIEDAEAYMGIGDDVYIEKYELSPANGPECSNTLSIYTDGVCKGNGRPEAVAGVGVYFSHGDSRNVSELLPGPRQTNQRADLTAVLKAIQIVSSQPQRSNSLVRRPIRIFTKSKYVIYCLTSGWRRWMKNGWMTAMGNGVKNRDLIEEILEEIRIHALNVRLDHINKSAGNMSLARANQLANCAIVERDNQEIDELSSRLGYFTFNV
ncbi:ribonuclease H-like protein [Martensiomyces pterosporus]|nr:ribonuclease H-like protein [Martensiomyces pterosporus]